jgi:hypothetical protein
MERLAVKPEVSNPEPFNVIILVAIFGWFLFIRRDRNAKV